MLITKIPLACVAIEKVSRIKQYPHYLTSAESWQFLANVKLEAHKGESHSDELIGG